MKPFTVQKGELSNRCLIKGFEASPLLFATGTTSRYDHCSFEMLDEFTAESNISINVIVPLTQESWAPPSAEEAS